MIDSNVADTGHDDLPNRGKYNMNKILIGCTTFVNFFPNLCKLGNKK